MIINNPNAGNIAHAVWSAADRTLSSGWNSIFMTVLYPNYSLGSGMILDLRNNALAMSHFNVGINAPSGGNYEFGWYDGGTYVSFGFTAGPITSSTNTRCNGAGQGFVLKNSGATAATVVWVCQNFFQ